MDARVGAPTQGRRRCRQARQLRDKGIAATDIAKMLERHRVSLPRGPRSLEPAEPQPLLNADQAAPRLTDEGQSWTPHHRRDAGQTCGSLTPTPRRGMRHADRAISSTRTGCHRANPLRRGHQDCEYSQSRQVFSCPGSPSTSMNRRRWRTPTGMVFLQPPQVYSLRATGPVSDSVTRVMTSRSSS